MKTIGIVAEYNPFHAGHLHQLETLRRENGADCPIVAVMSGDFVQRGEAAIYSKFARAAAAVECGVSLVLELPLPWCLSSAEGFARGGIGLLRATGAVDALSFGSESAELNAIAECAELLESPDYPERLHTIIKEGISFAAARERAVDMLGGSGVSSVLHSPNDTLAVEYLRAMKHLGWQPELLPVRREGSLHDGVGSASDIRRRMRAGESVASLVPERAAAVYKTEAEQGREPVLPEALSSVWLTLLRSVPGENFTDAPDTGEGLDNLLRREARTGTSFDEIAMACKSKRYALSRIRRALCCAALGLRGEDARGAPPYLRVLAMDEKGREVLRRMRTTAALPVIVKPATVRTLSEEAKRIFSVTSRGHDLYVLGFSSPAARTGGADYMTSPHCM